MSYNKEEDKPKIIQNDTIDSLLRKGQDNIMTNDVIQVPDYRYWGSQEQLDAWFQIRNLSKNTWYTYAWWLFNINTNWDITITWVWFIPKLIKFTAIYSSWISSSMSIWTYFNWVNNCVVLYDQRADYSNNSRCFRLWWTNWLWRVLSVNRDWFILNVTNPWLISYTVLYECC